MKFINRPKILSVKHLNFHRVSVADTDPNVIIVSGQADTGQVLNKIFVHRSTLENVLRRSDELLWRVTGQIMKENRKPKEEARAA